MRHPWWKRLGVAATLGSLAGALLASAARQEETPPVESGVEERVDVRILEVSLVAVDRNENPVLDLRAEDLAVTVGGKPSEIAYLDRPGAPPSESDEPLPDARLLIKIKSDYDEAAATNSEPRYFIFVVDVENNDLLRRDEEQDSMKAFIDDGGIAEQDLAAVLSYNGRLDIEQGFTRDRDALKRGIETAFDAPRRPVPTLHRKIEALISQAEMCEDISTAQSVPAGEPALSGGMQADERCLQELAHQYEQEHRTMAEDFLAALEATVRMAGGLQGRATIFVYSHGATIDPALEIREAFESVFGPGVQNLNLLVDYASGSKRFMDRVLELAARERVSFHFIDTTVQSIGSTSARRHGMLQANTRPHEVGYVAAQSNLKEMARDTGGSFREAHNAEEGLNRAMEIERGRYVLGVSLDTDPGKKLPEVDVRSTRGGVRIVTGRGVRAGIEPDSTIGGRITPGKPISLPDGKGVLLPFMVGFSVADLGYEAAGKKKNDTDRLRTFLSLHLSLQTADGRHIASTYHWIEHSVAGEQETDPSGVLAFKGGVEGPPGDYRLIAFIRNIKTGKGGRVVQDLTLPAPG